MKTKCVKNHKEKERKFTIICEVQKLLGFSVAGFSVGLFLSRGKKMIQLPSSLEKRVYLSSVRLGANRQMYEHDLHNCMIRTCWFVVTAAIAGATVEIACREIRLGL